MEQRLEESIRRVQENDLVDMIFHKRYSDDKNLQKAFLDGYAIGMLSSLAITASKSDNFGENTTLLQRAINGDKDAISTLEYLSNKK